MPNPNNRDCTSLISLFLVNWSLFSFPPLWKPPTEAEPNFASTSRDQNRKEKGGKARRGGQGSHAGRTNTWDARRNNKKSRQNSPKKDAKLEGY